MVKKLSDFNILWVDYGTKYIWLAYWNTRSGMVMPIGMLMNDQSLFYWLSDIVWRHHIGTVVVWYPKQHKKLQKDIDAFIQELAYLEDRLDIIKVDEEYSSVQAWATLWVYEKHPGTDTLAAMHLLESFIKQIEDMPE